MKTIINKLRYTLLLGFFAIAALGNSLNAATLTVCNGDGSTTNGYLPIYGFYVDDYQVNQMIYPEELLEDMIGGTISSLTFYCDALGQNLNGAEYKVGLGTTTQTEYTSKTRLTVTTVASGLTLQTGATQLVITFSPFTYNGGNLVIDFEITDDAGYSATKFYGENQSTNTAFNSYNDTYQNYTAQGAYSGGDLRKFLPKVTFGYTPSATPRILASPKDLTFYVVPNDDQMQTISVSGRNLSQGITATLNDANGFYSLNTTNLGNGGNLEVTYSPTAEGSHTATITLSSTGAPNVTINLSGTSENSIIVADGSDGSTVTTNAYLPIYAYYYDDYQKNQMIYPASMLTDLAGKTITSMTFYATNDFNFSGGQMTVRLGTTTNQDHYTSKTRLQPADMKIVKSGFDVPSGGNIWTIVFDSDKKFDYNGGNLVVDFEETSHGSGAGSYGANGFSFHGISHTGGGFYSNADTYDEVFSNVYSGGSVQNFLPKVKFLWEVSTPITNGTVSPDNVAFGAKNIGGTYTATVTVTNTGNQPFTPVIDVTGLPAGISVSPTTSGQVAPGGTLNLTVTFTPTAETSYSGSFTVTIPVPDGDDIVVTVNVTGSGYVVSSKLTSNMIEIPVYKSEAKADGTYIFSKDDVDDDIDMSLSYGSGDVSVEVLVKDDEPITSYDLRHKVGTGSWTSVATATQDASDPKSYVYNNDTFVIPSDATQMWLSMTDEGVDATSTIYYVPVTYANGVVTQGNTYGAPQVTATTVNLEPTLSIGGSKSAGRPGGHWTQNGTDVDYCVYTPVISISPVYPEGAVPYLVRAWLLENEDIPFFTVTRVANENDNNTHIQGGAELTYPHPLGEMELSSEMIGGPLTIGYDWTEDNAGSAGTTIQPNAFAAPSEMSQGEISIAVRVYYYKADATQSGQKALRDGSEAPADGYGYGEGNGSDEGIPTAVSSIYTDRQVVDVKYVNTIGMQSDKPFDGVNIVVTRYSDGSITTTKVLK